MPGLTAEEIYAIARRAGFSRQEAITMTAIAFPESSGNPRAHNYNPSTGDDSYGIWQINMLGDLGPARRRALGITSNADLYDPEVNARAARMIYKTQGFNAWSAFKSGKHVHFLQRAAKAALDVAEGWLEEAGESVSGAISGAVTSVPGVGGVVGAVQAASNITDIVRNFVSVILDPQFWFRAGIIVGGAVLVGLGGILVVRTATD